MNERLRFKCFSDEELFIIQYSLLRANPGCYGMFPSEETNHTRIAKKLLNEVYNETRKRDDEGQQ